MPSLHRLRHGLPGYLIPFTPHAVVPERQDKASKLPSQLVFSLISTHFTAPLGIPLTSPCLKNSSIRCSLSVEPIGFNRRLATPPADPLRPIIPANAWGLCITAPAGTELGAPFLCGTVICQMADSSHTTAVYNPKAFFLHAVSLGHTSVHCRRFSTAATRRCLDRVAVPVLGVVLSHPLPVVALVSHYLTN